MVTFPVWVGARTPRGPRTLVRADQITAVRVKDETDSEPRYVLEVHTPDGWLYLGQGATEGFRDHASAWLIDKIVAVSVRPEDPARYLGVRLTVLGEVPAPNGNLSFGVETNFIDSPFDLH